MGIYYNVIKVFKQDQTIDFISILGLSPCLLNEKEPYMDYLITFLEGIIAFISPCMLPLLPVYISYFAGGKRTVKKQLKMQ